jgi:cytoskeleton protein RodZ
VSLFQRIKTPFIESEEAHEAPPPRRTRAVGELLRSRREQLELDLDTVGEELRIRPAYLAALEQGRIEDLPGPAYAMGFVRAYANHLGLDGDRVLARYKADTADVHARPDLTLPVPLGERSLPGGPILLVALILALCGYGTWYYLSTGDRSRPERVAAVPADLKPAPSPSAATPPGAPTPAAPSGEPGATAGMRSGPPPVPGPEPRRPADATAPDSPPGLAANAAPTVPPPALSVTRPSGTGAPDPIVFPGSPPVPPPAGAAVQPAATPPSTTASPLAPPPSSAQSSATALGAGAGGDGRVAIRALADCWIQVRTADQTIVFSRVLKAGEIYHVPGRTGLSLRTGNAGALAIEVDGKPTPSIGAIGTLRRNVALDPEALVAGTAVQG